jgi:hypothetical protein
MRRLFMPAACALLLLPGCGGGTETLPGDGERGAVKAEAGCALAALKPALRETLVVIDRTMVKPAGAETFRLENPTLWSLINGLADVERAADTGAMAPRERLTIAIADPATGGLEQIFTGCIPYLSKEELAGRTAQGEDGFGSRFMGSDMESQIEQQRTAFQDQVLQAVALAKYGGQPRRGDGFAESGFVRALKTVGPGRGAADTIRRVFLFADPGAAMEDVPADHKAAREKGFTLAETLQANLGRSDLYVVPAGRALSDTQKAFLDALVLGSQGDLKAVAPFSPDGLAKPPVRVVLYSGELPLDATVKTPMDLRLASAADGAIVNSWLSYTGSRGVRATPVAGQFVCVSDGACNLRGDPNALGQRWRTEPGVSPQAMPSGPFGGMRIIEGRDDGQRLTGRIYDPVIFVGDRGDIPLVARRAE